jgi:hypothetical protein
MTRDELLEAAATKLTEVVNLLAAAGEQRLAFDAEALASRWGSAPRARPLRQGTRAEDLQKRREPAARLCPPHHVRKAA